MLKDLTPNPSPAGRGEPKPLMARCSSLALWEREVGRVRVIELTFNK
jgi:hypothetical protein